MNDRERSSQPPRKATKRKEKSDSTTYIIYHSLTVQCGIIEGDTSGDTSMIIGRRAREIALDLQAPY